MLLDSRNSPTVCADPFARLFPLPLSTVEAYMLADTTVAYPMSIDMTIHFDGRIERAAFEAGMAVALERAPLFRSIIETDPRHEPRWVLSEQPVKVDWAPCGKPHGADYETWFDLAKETPLRVYVREGREHSTVLLHFHHAAADGLGACGFIEDFLVGYANACSHDASLTLRPLEPERLLMREGAGAAGNRSVYRGLVDTLIGIREGIRFFCQRPRTLAPPLPPSEDPIAARRQVGYVSEVCPDGVAVGLRTAAAEARVTVNDLMLRDLFLTLRDWSTRQEGKSGNPHLRILMPQNLRERDDQATPAANMLGFAFITRRARRCEAPQTLLQSIHEETDAILRLQLSRYFLGSIASIRAASLLPFLLSRPLCFAGAVMTNIGNPQRRFVTRFPRSGDGLRIGNLIFTGVTGVPPLRPRTAAAFGITAQGRTYSVSLKCDPYAFSRKETQDLLSAFIARLAATAGGAP